MTSKDKSGWKKWSKFKKTESDELFLEKLWSASDSYGNTYEPNVEIGLAKFKKRISQEESKVIRLNSKSRPRWIQMAAAVVILLGVGLVVQNFLQTETPLQVVTTTDGNTKEIKLTDGTMVYLNENSQITFPEQFTGETRSVQLKGEAFFEVAKNVEKPFFIESDHGKIQVLGTAFNVRSIDEEDYEEVTVEHGKVAFSSTKSKESTQLVKAQKATLDKRTGKISIFEDEKLNSLAWRTKKLSFKGEKLEKIFNHLGRNTGVSFEVENQAVYDCTYTISFQILKIEEALKSLELASNNNLKFQKNDAGNYTVTGIGCN